ASGATPADEPRDDRVVGRPERAAFRRRKLFHALRHRRHLQIARATQRSLLDRWRGARRHDSLHREDRNRHQPTRPFTATALRQRRSRGLSEPDLCERCHGPRQWRRLRMKTCKSFLAALTVLIAAQSALWAQSNVPPTLSLSADDQVR